MSLAALRKHALPYQHPTLYIISINNMYLYTPDNTYLCNLCRSLVVVTVVVDIVSTHSSCASATVRIIIIISLMFAQRKGIAYILLF
eukprot:jgi/Picsp_1/3430/NSC_06268-R1_---NA---